MKEDGEKHVVYKVQSIDDATGEILVKEAMMYDNPATPFSGKVGLTSMMAKWQVAAWTESQKILVGPKQLTGQIRPIFWDIEAKKADIFKALLQMHTEQEDVPGPLVFWSKPFPQVRTGDVEVKKGQLKLVPLVPLSSIGLYLSLIHI